MVWAGNVCLVQTGSGGHCADDGKRHGGLCVACGLWPGLGAAPHLFSHLPHLAGWLCGGEEACHLLLLLCLKINVGYFGRKVEAGTYQEHRG